MFIYCNHKTKIKLCLLSDQATFPIVDITKHFVDTDCVHTSSTKANKVLGSSVDLAF